MKSTDTCILTGAEGDLHKEFLKVSGPLIKEYADNCQYDSYEIALGKYGRPSAWDKVPALLQLLERYENVIWVDSDIIVNPKAPPLENYIHKDAWQAVTIHRTPEGDVPNCGLWYVRRPMKGYLYSIWNNEKFIHHKWWENASFMEHLGFTLDAPCYCKNPTELWWKTTPLDTVWNCLPFYQNQFAWFRHAAGVLQIQKMELLIKWANDLK